MSTKPHSYPIISLCNTNVKNIKTRLHICSHTLNVELRYITNTYSRQGNDLTAALERSVENTILVLNQVYSAQPQPHPIRSLKDEVEINMTPSAKSATSAKAKPACKSAENICYQEYINCFSKQPAYSITCLKSDQLKKIRKGHDRTKKNQGSDFFLPFRDLFLLHH